MFSEETERRLAPPRPPLPMTAMLSLLLGSRARRKAGAPRRAAPAAAAPRRKPRRLGRARREREAVMAGPRWWGWDFLVPRLCLGTNCLGGSASRAVGRCGGQPCLSRGVAARRSLAAGAFRAASGKQAGTPGPREAALGRRL